MESQITVSANVNLYAIEPDGARMWVGGGRNRVVEGGLNAMLAALRGDAAFADGFVYSDLGTDGRAVMSTDTALFSPLLPDGRAIILPDATLVTNSLTLQSGFVSLSVSAHIREAGLWMGDTANTTPNTGVLVARVVVDVDNSDARRDIALDWRITFEAVTT